MKSLKIHSYGPRATIISDENGTSVAKIYGAGTEAQGYKAGAKEACDANLQMFLAAPDMLEALRLVQMECVPGSLAHILCGAAIAKAVK